MEKTHLGKGIAQKNGWFLWVWSWNGYGCFTTKTVSVRTHPLQSMSTPTEEKADIHIM